MLAETVIPESPMVNQGQNVRSQTTMQMHVCMDVWMYGCMDGWMDGWMDVLVCGSLRQIDK